MNNPAEIEILGDDDINGFIGSGEEDYINCVRYIHSDPAYGKGMAMRGRSRAKQLYSLDRMISQWNEVFSGMMQQPKRARGVLQKWYEYQWRKYNRWLWRDRSGAPPW